jgi:hypothetical protein
MRKSKLVRSIVIVVLVIMMGCILSGCTSSSPQQTTTKLDPAAVMVIPSIAAPGATVSFAGANFQSGEEVNVYMQMYPKTPPLLLGTSKVEGKILKANELGSFTISDKVPADPGIYPIKVYNKNNELRAVSLVVVQAPPAPAPAK